MVDYKQILRLDALGVSGRAIADALGCSRNTVASVLGAARSKGVVFDQVANLEPVEVRHLLLPRPPVGEPGRTAPDYARVHAELMRPNVTLQLLWGEYATATRDAGEVPYSYSTFTRGYRAWVQVTGATMTITRKPGELVEVDWAGNTMIYLDAASGSARKAYLFVAALPYSAYFYVEAFADMKLASWIEGHVAAFEHFGGAGRLLTYDYIPRHIIILLCPLAFCALVPVCGGLTWGDVWRGTDSRAHNVMLGETLDFPSSFWKGSCHGSVGSSVRQADHGRPVSRVVAGF